MLGEPGRPLAVLELGFCFDQQFACCDGVPEALLEGDA
jgi:hypothetical protein